LIGLSSSVAPYVIGSTRPPRRTNRALHEGSRVSLSVPHASASGVTDEDEGPITTARRNPSSTTRPTAGGVGDNSRGGTTVSVMRDWVNELTGGDGSSPGLRIPSEAEISQVSAMFPNVGRETVVGALQRRYVPDFFFSPTYPRGPHVGRGVNAKFPTFSPSFSYLLVLARSLTNRSWTANLAPGVNECTLVHFQSYHGKCH